jgi:hypothetical protein
MSDAVFDFGPNALGVFLFATLVIGGGGGFLTGRALAQTWRPVWQLPASALLLTLWVRFLHHAMFAEPFLPLGNLAVDYVVVLATCALGYRLTRARQIATQYGFAFERSGLLGWRRIADAQRTPSG